MDANRNLTAHESAGVVIIGGGVIGLTLARALARRGLVDVVVIEKAEFGCEASWAAGGILAPQLEADTTDDFFRLACRSRDMYREFANDLQEESGIDVELDTTGTLYVAFSDKEEVEFHARYDWQRSHGLAVEWLKCDEARKLEPLISEQVRCALRFPNDFQVENRKLIEALIVVNQRLGVRLIRQCEAQKIELTNESVSGVRTSKSLIRTPIALIAAGAWSSLIGIPEMSSVEPVRGQMLSFSAPGVARHVIYSTGGYLIPRRDGRLLAGSTTEHVGFDKRVTDEGIERIRSMALQIAPALRHRPILDSWAGLRPFAREGLPILGHSQNIEGLFYATGHFRNGILLAPITGELIADAIVFQKSSPLLQAFAPTRALVESSDNQSIAARH